MKTGESVDYFIRYEIRDKIRIYDLDTSKIMFRYGRLLPHEIFVMIWRSTTRQNTELNNL